MDKKNKQTSNVSLYAYGDFDNYGNYIIVCANNINEATDIIKKEQFKEFKNFLKKAKKGKLIDKNGKPLNGLAETFIYCKNKNYYSMDNNTLFDVFCENEFGKDLWRMECCKKIYHTINLKTNVWHGEFA